MVLPPLGSGHLSQVLGHPGIPLVLPMAPLPCTKIYWLLPHTALTLVDGGAAATGVVHWALVVGAGIPQCLDVAELDVSAAALDVVAAGYRAVDGPGNAFVVARYGACVQD
jgi:hypothetical protein